MAVRVSVFTRTTVLHTECLGRSNGDSQKSGTGTVPVSGQERQGERERERKKRFTQASLRHVLDISAVLRVGAIGRPGHRTPS